jgi:hypothetical protein
VWTKKVGEILEKVAHCKAVTVTLRQRLSRVGTKVATVDEPVKAGRYNGIVYIEVHANGFDEDGL